MTEHLFDMGTTTRPALVPPIELEDDRRRIAFAVR
jgi:hypothetical protein